MFVLAIFVGYHVMWNVTPALHTPLMSVTNAISSVIIVGAMLAAGPGVLDWGASLGAVAVALVAINTFGGFLVTSACWRCSRRKSRRGSERSTRGCMTANQVALLVSGRRACFILALKGLSHPLTARRGNRFGIAGMAIAVAHDAAPSPDASTSSSARSPSAASIGWLVAQARRR